MFRSLQVNARHGVEKFLAELEHRVSEMDSRDTSVYTGKPGIALLYYHLDGKLPPRKEISHIQKALGYLEYSLNHVKRHRISFICGSPGPLAISAAIYKELNMKDDMNRVLKE